MSDVFREVDEALQEDRARALWTRYGRVAIAIAVVLILSTAAVVYWQNQQAERQAAVADRLIRALVLSDQEPAEAAQAMAMLGDEADGRQRAVARLLEAAMRQSLDEAAAAAGLLDAVARGADGAAAGDAWQDLAALQAALQSLSDGDGAEGSAVEEIAGLAAGEGPWRHAAQEIAAIEALTAGDLARAGALFEGLAGDATAPPSVRQRAGELADMLND